MNCKTATVSKINCLYREHFVNEHGFDMLFLYNVQLSHEFDGMKRGSEWKPHTRQLNIIIEIKLNAICTSLRMLLSLRKANWMLPMNIIAYIIIADKFAYQF